MRVSTAQLGLALMASLTACGAPKTESVHHPVNEEPLVLDGVSTDSADVPTSSSSPKKNAFANDNETTTDNASGVPGMPGSGSAPSLHMPRTTSTVSRSTFGIALGASVASAGVEKLGSTSWNGTFASGVTFKSPSKKRLPAVAGVKATTAAYGFKDDRLLVVQARFKGAAACRKIQKALESTNHLEGPGPGVLPSLPIVEDAPMESWDDGTTSLDFHAWYTSKAHKQSDDCTVDLTDDGARAK